MKRPWMLMTATTAIERVEDCKKIAEKFDLVIVQDHDFDEAVRLIGSLSDAKITEVELKKKLL